MTVYIEYVIIDNLVIDYMLLKATFALTGITVGRGRLFLCSLIGTAVALLYPMLEIFSILITMLKISCGLLMVLIGGRYSSFRDYFINALLFFVLTFLSGGAIIGIYSLFGIDYSSQMSVATIFLPTYILIRSFISVIRYIFRRKNISGFTYKVQLAVNEKNVTVNGFLDTGNALYDKGEPVILCNLHTAKKLIDFDFARGKIKMITVKTVTATKNYPSFKADLKIYLSDKPNIYKNVTVCVLKHIGDGYDLILHPDLMEESYVKESVFKTKEVG